MAYNVSSAFREQLYSGESDFRAILTIGENTIDNDQIASISISSPIIDDSKKVFYVGTFISQKITIKFKNMDGIDVHSGDNVDLSIGQYVNNEWVDVPIGKFLVDDLAEDYFEKCEFSCLDYAVKFKPNIDYSECFVDGKATIETILKYICNIVGVQLGSYPTINNDIEIGTYDSTVSGKQWISYIAEIKGCNAKMDRQGRLTLQPLKQSSNVPINALESASFELGEKYKISQVVYFDALRNYTFGNDKENTLYIRQENPFINDENVIKEIYKSIINEQRSETEATDFDLYNTDEFDLSANKMYGETSQETGHGYQMLINTNVNNGYNYWSEYSTYDKETRTLTRSTTATSESFIVHTLKNNIIKNNTTYTLSCWVKQNGKVRDVDFFMYGASGGAVGIRSKTFSDIGTNWVKKTWTFTSDASANYTNAYVRFDNNGSTTSGQEAILYLRDVMLEEGSVAHDYEDYPTSPDNPHNVNTVTGRNVVNITGKNLFNVSLYDGSDKTGQGTVSNDGNTITFTSANTDSYTPSMWSETQFYDHRKMAMPCEPNTTYTFSFDVDSTPNGRIYIYEGDKNYQGVGQAGTIDYSSITKTITFTTSANTYYLIFRFVLWSATTINISNIQLEKEEQTSYEPYKSQSYEIDLGKNLIDMATLIYGIYRVGDGTYVSSSNAKCTKNMMKIDNAKNYTLSIKSSNTTDYIYVLFYDANKTYLGNIAKKISSKELTLNTYANYLNAKYINIRIDDITFTELQLEEGSVATSYAPYYNVTKNLLKYPYTDTTKTTNGITFTDNGDGTITISGTASANASFRLLGDSSNQYNIDGNYVSGGISANRRVQIVHYNPGYSVLANSSGSPARINKSTYTTGYIEIVIANGEAITTPITIQPMMTYENDNIYEPYDKHIELCKIGEYQDYITKNTGKNLSNGINQGYFINQASNGCGITTSDSGLAIKVDGGEYTVSTISTQTRYRVACMNELPTTATAITAYNGINNDGTNNNITIDTTGYEYLVVNATDLTKIQIEEGSTATEYEPYGKDEWYEYHRIGKNILDGSENNIGKSGNNANISYYYSSTATDNTYKFKNINTSIMGTTASANIYPAYSNYFKFIQGNQIFTDIVGAIFDYISNTQVIELRLGFGLNSEINTVDKLKTWLNTHNLNVYYVLANPDVRKITYQPLIDQLNAIEKMKSYEGKTYITSRGVEENSPIDIKYYINTDFELWSLKTHNYGDFTLDAWDNINYELDGTHYLTLNNNNIKYEMSIMGDVESKIPTKQQEVTTNVVGGDDSVNIKKIKTEVDNLNGTATILAEKTDNNSDQISQLRVEINAIQNLFTLTGGRNNVRNSAFLLTDEVWNFTNNGSNPYHTTFGKSYDISLAGKTVSISEIKLQDTIAKTNSDNITGIRNDGTRYNLSFYYKQDADTTTTIKLYDTNNSSVKAFDDIIITGEKEFRSYNISFVPTSTNYTLEIVTSTTSSTGAFYLYDLMLNSGDRQPWSPAPDEVYSTTLTMSRLGLKVYSVGDGTITLLGSDGLVSYETTDGQTLGRLVSKRTVNGDLTKSNTSELIGLVPDIVAFEEGTDKRRWVDTSIELNGKLHRITYLETGE